MPHIATADPPIMFLWFRNLGVKSSVSNFQTWFLLFAGCAKRAQPSPRCLPTCPWRVIHQSVSCVEQPPWRGACRGAVLRAALCRIGPARSLRLAAMTRRCVLCWRPPRWNPPATATVALTVMVARPAPHGGVVRNVAADRKHTRQQMTRFACGGAAHAGTQCQPKATHCHVRQA